MESTEIVEGGTILRVTVGSTVHGLHHGGQDDRDEMAVYIEPPEYLVGLRVRAGSAAGSTASSTTSSGPSPKGSAPARATSISSPTACASTSGLPSKGTPTILLSPYGACRIRARRDRPRAGACAPCGTRSCSKTAGRGYLGYLRWPEGAAARYAWTEEREPARAGRRSRVRHEVRDARRTARLPGTRAARARVSSRCRCPSLNAHG